MNAIIQLNLIDGDTVFLNLSDKHVWVGEGWIALGNDYEESQTFAVALTDGSTDKDLLAGAVRKAYGGLGAYGDLMVTLNQRETIEDDESEDDESEDDESEDDESEDDESEDDESGDDESEDDEVGGC